MLMQSSEGDFPMMNYVTKAETKWDDEFLLLELVLQNVMKRVYISIMSLQILQPLSAVLILSYATKNNCAVSECDLMEHEAL